MAVPSWQCLIHDPTLQRSSHTLAILEHQAYIFGGELAPRQPRDNAIFSVDLDAHGRHSYPLHSLTNKKDVSVKELGAREPPSPRVGTASTAISSKIYVFSGRGGPSMTATEESGGLWCFDSSLSTWYLITPADDSAKHPAARSYHCMASDGVDKIYLHAGCPVAGRLADLWAFSVSERTWTKLADAPGAPRGGSSIAFSGGKLYRMNGFDGRTEQGGSIDIYNIETNEWTERKFTPNGVDGPEARSVSALLPAKINGRTMLVTLFGERDPSVLGHAGAGKMLGDVWSYDLEKNEWKDVQIISGEIPPARGWFDADVLGSSKIVVAGGLNEANERLDDVWVLSL